MLVGRGGNEAEGWHRGGGWVANGNVRTRLLEGRCCAALSHGADDCQCTPVTGNVTRATVACVIRLSTYGRIVGGRGRSRWDVGGTEGGGQRSSSSYCYLGRERVSSMTSGGAALHTHNGYGLCRYPTSRLAQECVPMLLCPSELRCAAYLFQATYGAPSTASRTPALFGRHAIDKAASYDYPVSLQLLRVLSHLAAHLHHSVPTGLSSSFGSMVHACATTPRIAPSTSHPRETSSTTTKSPKP